jgi:hypothetical protein
MVLFGAAAFLIYAEARDFIRTDRCLDLGGRWDHEKDERAHARY